MHARSKGREDEQAGLRPVRPQLEGLTGRGEPSDGDRVLKQNEEDANRNVSRILMLAALVAVLVIALSYTSIVKTPKGIIWRDFGAGALLLAAPPFIYFVLGKSGSWFKYLALSSTLAVMIVLYSDWNIFAFVFIAWFVPLVIATVYFDVKLTIFVSVVTMASINLIDLLNRATIFTPVKFVNGTNVKLIDNPDILADSIFIDSALLIVFIGLIILAARTRNLLTDLVDTEKEAVRNARLYATERQIAETLQQASVDMPEKVPGIRFSYLYRSAVAEAGWVGGDFYDLFELDEERVAVVIGDIAGKGLEAATLIALVKNAIRAYAYEGYLPGEVLSKANMALRLSTSKAAFVTVFLATLNKRTGELIYCCAGHPPALIRRKKGRIETLRSGEALPIGAFPEAEYRNRTGRITKGDIVFLHTDGVTEARRGEDFFREEGLARALSAARPPAEGICDQIFGEVLSFTGGAFRDDIALLAVGMG